MLQLGRAVGRLQGEAVLLGQHHAVPYSVSPDSCALNVHKRWPECIEYSPEASPPGLVSSQKIRFMALETTLLRAEVQ